MWEGVLSKIRQTVTEVFLPLKKKPHGCGFLSAILCTSVYSAFRSGWIGFKVANNVYNHACALPDINNERETSVYKLGENRVVYYFYLLATV